MRRMSPPPACKLSHAMRLNLRRLAVAVGLLMGAGTGLQAFSPLQAVHAAAAAPTAIREDVGEMARKAAQEWFGASPDAQHDGERAIHAIAVLEVDAKPSDPDYVSKREGAYAKAAVDAMKQVQAAMGMRIEAAINADVRLEQVIGDPVLAKALVGLAAGRGGDAVKLEQEVRMMVRTAGAASMAGFSIVQSFEVAVGDHAAVAVVGVVSARTVSWVRKGGEDVPSDGLQKWFESIAPEVLCRTYGTRFVPDENGRMWLVAFGRKEVSAAPFVDRFRELAVKESQAAATRTLAASVLSRGWAEGVAKAKLIQDLKPDWRRVERFEDAVEVTSRDPQLRVRLVPLSARKVLDPIAGKDIFVAAHAVPLGDAAGGIEPGFGCPDVPEEMRKSTRQAEARGSGATYEDAVRSALKDAISQVGVYIEFEERRRDEFEELKEKVDSEISAKYRDVSASSTTSRMYGDGFIHSFAVVQQMDDDGGGAPRVTVRICANVVRFNPDDPRFGKAPTIVVLPAAVRRDAVRVAGVAADPDPHARAIESAIEGCLLDAPKRFKLLSAASDPRLPAVRERIREQVRNGQAQPMEAMKLGGVLTPDYVVTIDVVRLEFVKANPGQPAGIIGPDDSATAEIRCRIVNVADDGIASWHGSADITLDVRSLPLPARRPDERALTPVELVRRRAIGSLQASLKAFLGGEPPRPQADAGPDGAAPRSGPGGPRLIAVLANEVSLDASSPLVKVGARFAIENPVTVNLSSGTLFERDRVALIQVTEIADGVAKARLVEGDIDLVNPQSSELVPAS